MERHEFPLALFLTSLSADGIRVTVRDYERISLVLSSSGTWTIIRLRDTLQALLTQNEEQQAIFSQCFKDFFKLKPDPEKAFAEIDLQRALADLERLA